MAGLKLFDDAPTGTPAAGNQRSPSQLTARLNELLGFINEIFESTFQGKIIKLGSGGAIEGVDAVESIGGAVSIDPTGLAAGDILYHNGTNLIRVPAGDPGQILQSNGTAAPSWGASTSLATRVDLSPANGSTTDLSENTRYVVNPSAGNVTLRLLASPTVTTKFISFLTDGANSWEDNNYTLDGNGNNIVVVNNDGSVTTPVGTITILANVSFFVFYNGTNYVVLKGVI